METHFQTSFIPKKPATTIPGGGVTPLSPLTARHSHSHSGAGIFMAIAVTLFVVSLLSIGGVYIWKQVLLNSQSTYEQSLAEREKSFNIDQISLMKGQATKILLARQLLSNHMSVSKIFSVISKLTSENVRFLSMELTVPAGTQNSFQLVLSGYGRSFPSVAFQSDVLNQLDKYGLRTVVKNAIVSDPALNHDGTVNFGFTAQIDPSSFAYSKSLIPAQSAAAANAVASTSTQGSPQ